MEHPKRQRWISMRWSDLVFGPVGHTLRAGINGSFIAVLLPMYKAIYMGVYDPICIYKQGCSPRNLTEKTSQLQTGICFFWFGWGRSAFVGGELGGCNLHGSFAGNVMFKKSFTNYPTTQISLYTQCSKQTNPYMSQ